MMIKKDFFLRISLLIILCASVTLAKSQQQKVQQENDMTIKGKVSDEKQVPLPGVTVKIEGTSIGTLTDADGNFTINLPQNKNKLTFSYVGYLAQTIEVFEKVINVRLESDTKQLEEIVVVGYGTQRVKDLTGNIATVSSKDFEKSPVTNAEALIANKISGVQVLSSSGKPGAGSSFLIQGGASLNASNDPLIVIDGLPIEGWNSGPGMISQLNPNDIETFTVLKDASASAIYGSRASNGVILITTKKGGKGKIKIDFSANARISTIRKKTDVLSASEYRALATELGSKMKVTPGQYSTDWQDEIFQNALASDYNLSVNGSFLNIPYRISTGYLNEEGILKTGKYERTTAAINLSPSFLDESLKININLKGSYENERLANDDAIWVATYFDPTQPVHVDDQTYGGYFQYTQYESNPYLTKMYNPLSMLEQVDERNKTIRSIGNLQADYSFFFLPDLHININAGYDVLRGEYTLNAPDNYFFYNKVYSSPGGRSYKGDPSKTVDNKIFESYIFYKKELPSIKSKFDATVGYSYNDFTTKNYYYPTYYADGSIISSTVPTYEYDKPSHSIVSFYGRLNYALLDKYLFTASIRDDASSRFSEKNRWGVFPSMALAWKIKEEFFLKNVNVISDLKLRVGYGITGQQDGLDNYYHIKKYTTSGLAYQYKFGNTSTSAVFPQVYNPDLKWEQTTTTTIGLDFGLIDQRITGSIDLYNKETKDLLNSITIPYGYSFSSTMTKNIGSMENKGIGFNIKAIIVKAKNMSWDMSFNATYNENKITKISLDNKSGVGLFSDATLVNTIGYGRNTYYLYHQLYDEKGTPIEDQMLDVNKDGLINASDRYVTGKSAIPKYLLGFNTNFQYKDWSFGASFHSNLGHYIFYMPQETTLAMTDYSVSQNLNASYFKSKFHYNAQYQGYSDYYLQNASFLKMDNAYIGYDFGQLLSKSTIKLKASISVQNIFTITDFTGLDPETNSGYQNTYPIPRIFALGLNLSF